MAIYFPLVDPIGQQPTNTAPAASRVTNMSSMFCATVFNQDLLRWDTSSITSMKSMFHLDTVFNQDLSSWNTSSITDMTSMFSHAKAFSQDLCAWNDTFMYIKLL